MVKLIEYQWHCCNHYTLLLHMLIHYRWTHLSLLRHPPPPPHPPRHRQYHLHVTLMTSHRVIVLLHQRASHRYSHRCPRINRLSIDPALGPLPHATLIYPLIFVWRKSPRHHHLLHTGHLTVARWTPLALPANNCIVSSKPSIFAVNRAVLKIPSSQRLMITWRHVLPILVNRMVKCSLKTTICLVLMRDQSDQVTPTVYETDQD